MADAPKPMSISVVFTRNLGPDFVVDPVAQAINLAAATTSTLGKVRFATNSEISNGTPGYAVDAAQLKAAIALDGYRLKKAINANATTAAAGGVDAMIAYVTANNSPGSNAVQALGSSAPLGGDLETLVLVPWLQDAVGNGGVGLSSSSSPSLAATVAALRSSALYQSP